MKINILLPYKEKFDENRASSVSIAVKNNLSLSSFFADVRVYGQTVEKPIFKENFIGFKYSIFSFKSKNKFLAYKMLKKISKESDQNQLIEVHNRPYLIDVISRKNNFPISLFFHNDPLTMKGSKTVKDRENILDRCTFVFCVSEYIKIQFLRGISNDRKKVHVMYNGVLKKVNIFPEKKNEILFVGRLVPEKGVALYADAAKSLASKYPDWSFSIIGSFKLGELEATNSFVKLILNKFNKIGDQAKFYGFKDQAFVEEKMKTASIIVIPSLWQEPFGLVAAEAMSNGICIVASKVGGLPEIIKDNGILLEDINLEKLKTALITLISNDKLRDYYQQKAWANFKLKSSVSSKRLDNFRKIIFRDCF